jgi:Calpain family cysteine protease
VLTTKSYAADSGSDFSQVVHANFKKWDSDNDGSLSGREIDHAILDPSNTGSAAAALSTLRGAHDKAKKSGGDTRFTEGYVAGMNLEGGTARNNASAFKKAEDKLSGERMELFAPGAPHLQSVHQGKTGDCYLISAIGSMVSNRPEELRSLIKANKGGRYTVYFYNANPVSIDRPTDGEFATFGNAIDDGMWLNVLEKAFATLKLKPDEQEDDMYSEISGGRAATAIRLLTGHKTKRFNLKDEIRREKAEHLAKRALLDRRLVVTGIRTPGKNGKSSAHCLAVISINEKRDQVTIWNPYGRTENYKGYQMEHGFFTIPIEEWLSKFSSVSVEVKTNL